VTVVSALATAGFTPDGWPQQIRLSRPGRNGEPDADSSDRFYEIAEFGDLTQNYLVEDGDIIQVPYNPLSAWNYTLQRLSARWRNRLACVDAVGVVSSARELRTVIGDVYALSEHCGLAAAHSGALLSTKGGFIPPIHTTLKDG